MSPDAPADAPAGGRLPQGAGRFVWGRWLRALSPSHRRWRAEPAAPEPGGLAGPRLPVPGTGTATPRRLLFVNQYYWPDHASTAQHLTDLVESLAAEGHDCHVLCAQGRYKPGAPRPPAHEVHNGVHIHRVPATSLGRKNTLFRMTDYLSFYARALALGVSLPRFDVIVTLTTPPIIGLIGTLLRRFKGSRHVYWSMDLHPDASLALGRMSRANPVVAWLAWLSDFVYRQADKVVVLGPYMADRILAKRVRPDRVTTIPVWSRLDEIFPIPRAGHPLRAELGLADKFVAMYSGNLGLAHSTAEFLDAARQLRDRDDLVFLFVGDGPRMAEVREAQAAEGLSNIRFLDYFPREQLHASLSVADAHLISMRPEMTGIVVPGKLYGVMASGRPAVFVGPDHCESAETIRQAGCGLTVRLGDADGLVEALTRLAAEPRVAEAMGERGRAAFLAGHERGPCCSLWSRVIGDLVARPRATAPTPLPRPVVSALTRVALCGAFLLSGLPARAEGPTAAPKSVAEIQSAHDRALVGDIAAYLTANPKAADIDQAYMTLFDKVIEHDWFAAHETLAKQYLALRPDGPVRSLAQIVATMARAQAGDFAGAVARFHELMGGLGKPDQEEFAANFTDSLAAAATAAGEYDVSRKVYNALLDRYGESPTLRQKVKGELARLDKVGKPAPEVVARDLAGERFRLDGLRGKYVLVDFWATWCAPWVADVPRLQAAYAKYHGVGFEVVGVSLDETRSAAADFVKVRGLPGRQLHNASCEADLVEAFGVATIPATFLIDPRGVITRLDLRGASLDQALAKIYKDAGVRAAR